MTVAPSDFASSKFLLGDIYGNNLGAKRIGNHDGRKAHAAATMNRDPLPGGHPTLIDDGAERGDKAAAEAGSGRKFDGLRQFNQINIGIVNGNIFGE